MMNLNLDVDDIWKALGPWGRYQRFQLFLLSMDGMATAFHLLSTVVIGYRYPYACKEAEYNCSSVDLNCDNSSIFTEYGKCSIDIYRNGTNQTLIKSQDCINGYTYPVSKDRTFVTEWDLVCGKAELGEFTQTLVIIGQATGAAIFPQFSDRFGRKPVHIVAHIGIFSVALAMAFVPSYTAFSVLRWLVGTCQQGVVMTNFVMSLEILPRESRFGATVLGFISWTSGIVLLAPLGYLFRNISWRYLQMTLAIYSTYSLFAYWILDESLRWLIANGKHKEAERIIRKAARWNNVNFNDVIKQARTTDAANVGLIEDTNMSLVQSDINEPLTDNNFAEQTCVPLTVENRGSEKAKERQEDNGNAAVEKYTLVTILKTRKVLINSIILWYIWIVDSMTYYGIALNSYSLAGDRFLNFFLTTIMDYPAHLSNMMLMNRIGRKYTVIYFHVVTGVSLLTATVFMTLADGNSSMLTASTVFTLIGKYGSAGSFCSLFLYTPELYPTNLRNAGLGVSSSISRIGGMLAPFAGPLAERIKWAPGTIFGSMCMLVTVLCTRLPETKRFELAQTLEEMDTWSKESEAENTKIDENKL